ncbi:ABC transporter substrate-binding protein [Euhalothece natronophila Z-M001]|uniref:ABC transporter substrate-binding protein n=1 Tax=Euhalothece natronophila Z-M001 TaxID=522448 RepID=A0A5B8NJ44_9CHRO|nr:ABC transporter substrate-binding protein [Euhalothece natronophila]QDZ38988.1 ABC transporter substrate-binding protein [Euhalothece natronophila Z-M001]
MSKRKGPPPIVYIVGVLVLGFGGYQVYQMLASGEENDIVENGNGAIEDGAIDNGGNGEPDSAELSDLSHRFSIGDKVLISSSSASQEFVELKEQGVAAIASQNYSEAVDHLEAALAENRNDPEALIYLNNARIGNDEAYDIAVPVPIDADTVFFSLEMLRGYAQAQNEINEAGGVNGTPIRLTLVNDSDRAREATEIAQELGDRDNILAVTGHWSSSTTLAAAPIYDQNELVLLNPVSTSTEISGISDYVFRTIPSNFVVGATMAEYALDDLDAQNVAIFYDSDSGYSLSLRRELSSSLSTRGGSVVGEYDLSESGFRARDRLQNVREQDAEVIVLIPSPATVDRSLEIVNVNEQDLPLIGDIGNLYGIRTLDVGREDAVGMVIPVPWHILEPQDEDFVQTSRELWGGDVNWATVMAYDSLNAIAEALEQDPTREGIRNALASDNFSAEGVVQPVRFLPSGDRDGQLTLVEVQPADPSRSGTGYDFVPLE